MAKSNEHQLKLSVEKCRRRETVTLRYSWQGSLICIKRCDSGSVMLLFQDLLLITDRQKKARDDKLPFSRRNRPKDEFLYPQATGDAASFTLGHMMNVTGGAASEVFSQTAPTQLLHTLLHFHHIKTSTETVCFVWAWELVPVFRFTSNETSCYLIKQKASFSSKWNLQFQGCYVQRWFNVVKWPNFVKLVLFHSQVAFQSTSYQADKNHMSQS